MCNLRYIQIIIILHELNKARGNKTIDIEARYVSLRQK